ncbi:MAG TPA: DUF6603 domain-containing protein [Pyrinomonadaceae bacterium]|nr:DUF6603 domain-containing protein [Pyrinomonadaceae bacterium]
MSDERGTLELIGRHLSLALYPLSDAVSGTENFKQFLYRLGWNAEDMPPAYANLGALASAAVQALENLDETPSPEAILDLIKKAKDAFDGIQSITDAPAGVDATEFLAEIGERMFELLLTDYLAAELPAAYNLLSALNVIEPVSEPASSSRPSYMRVKFKWEELPKIVSDPLSIPGRVYGWGTNDLDFTLVAEHLSELLVALDFPVIVEHGDDELVQGYAGLGQALTPETTSLIVPFYFIEIAGKDVEAGFVLRELPAAQGKLPGMVIEPRLPSEFPLTLHLAETIDLRLRAGTNVAQLFGILIRPGDLSIKYPLAPGTTPPSAGVGVGFDFHPKAPVILLGERKATRLEFQGAAVDFGADFVNNELEVLLGAELRGLALILAAGEGDSFLRKIIGDGQTKIEVPLGFEWSSRYGFRFKGSASFEVALHPHLKLGPIAIDDVIIRLIVPSDPQPKALLTVGVGLSGDLGPLKFVVEQVGLSIQTTFVRGNVGPFDIKLGFKPPDGIGLSINGGGFKGGGFLKLDFEKGEYVGILEIEFQGTISLKAVGILNTRLPDGRKGFSLLIIITAEFTPIQLGFGFTLIGVGGLLGLNRTARFDVLRAGVKEGSLNSILFPKDVVANAPRIINDLQRIFPPQEGHFLIGPMAKLGWGTPPLITLEIGLLLEIPRPAFAILGVLRMTLPNERAKVLKLQVSFIGIFDFEKKQISFDATLFDSSVLTFTLTGDMALRLYYGDDANFLVTVGGFHPAYVPPPMNLGKLDRLALVIFSGNPSLRAETYFALTSNTVQFGARIELSARAGSFGIYGFLSLDVLIQFSPFHFVAEIAAMVAVKLGGSTLFSVRVRMTLEGPTPWHARGEASFEIGFIFTITITVGFDATFGEARHDTLPPIEVMPELRKALESVTSWRAQLPSQSNLNVSLRTIEGAEENIVLHPFGTLRISQKVVPLNLDIDKFGNQRPASDNHFSITSVNIGNQLEELFPVREQFAPAQFIEMSDAEKIARRSFETMDAGVELGGSNAATSDYAVRLDVEYEVIYLPERKPPLFVRIISDLFNILLLGNATSKSPLSFESKSPSVLGAEKVVLKQEQFAIASTSTLQLHQASLLFDSEAEAHASLERLVRANPGLREEVQVISSYQLNKL